MLKCQCVAQAILLKILSALIIILCQALAGKQTIINLTKHFNKINLAGPINYNQYNNS